MLNKKDLHYIIRRYLKPRFVKSEPSISFGFDHIVCPICGAEVMAWQKVNACGIPTGPVEHSEEIEHKPDCYWAIEK